MNIWEIVTLNDLIKILKEKENKIVIVAIILENTPNETRNILKKFLKIKAKQYENLTFLYYKASSKDLGRFSLLPKNIDEYPYVYHIYNTSEIFVKINNANEKTIYEAFNAVEEYYKRDLDNYLLNKNETINDKNNVNPNESNIVINQEINNLNINKQNIDDEKEAELNRKALEHQKLLEKIAIYEEKKEEYKNNFLYEIQKRKKEEKEKIKK